MPIFGIMGAIQSNNQAKMMQREQVRQRAQQDKALVQRDFEDRKLEQQKRATRAQAEMSTDIAYKRSMGVRGAGEGTLLGGNPSIIGIRNKTPGKTY